MFMCHRVINKENRHFLEETLIATRQEITSLQIYIYIYIYILANYQH